MSLNIYNVTLNAGEEILRAYLNLTNSALSLGIIFLYDKQHRSEHLCTFIFTHSSDGLWGTCPHGWRGRIQGFGQSQSPVRREQKGPWAGLPWGQESCPDPRGGSAPGPDLLSPDPSTWTEAQTLVTPVFWCPRRVRPGSLVIWRQVSVWWVIWLHRETKLQG